MRRRELLLLAAAGCFGAWWLLRTDGSGLEPNLTATSASPSTHATTRTAQATSPLLPSDVLPTLLATSPRYPTETPEKAYLSDRVMLSVEADASLLAVARDHGATIASMPGPSGYGALWVPPGATMAELRSELLLDARVLDAGAIGVMYGASDGLPVSWQIEATKADEVGASPDFSGIVVAVLDTGVAYEDYSADGVSYVQAVNLAGNSFVAPWDFVNDDAHANDDHQHGTHIACTIACEGVLNGYAPGATIMPIKVLGYDNSGIETDLIDAIWHAIDHDADVINMSLSFGQGYVLSTGLNEALEAAHEAGIVVLAASGNDGLQAISYPAAHPHVFGVGASTLKDQDKQQSVAYGNRDPAVDMVAPGGDLDADANGDGYPDGILAETITYQDPSSTGYWFYAGTSQATAVASGAAVWLLERGASRDDVYTALQLGAESLEAEIQSGYGTGRMRLKEAMDKLLDAKTFALPQHYVAMMPYLKDCGDELEPKVLITTLDSAGVPVDAGKVYGTFTDQDGTVTTFKCDTNGDGQCTAKIDKVDKFDASGDEIAWAWAVRVSTIYHDNASTHPGTAFFASDALEILLAGLDGAGIATSPLGLKWDHTVEYPDMDDVSDAYVFPNLGTGIATSPLGVIATPPMIEPFATMDTVWVDLDGTGIATSPLGVVPLPRLIFDGTGIATSPLGLTQITIIPIGGVGIATSPLGFTPPTLLDPLAPPAFDEPTIDFQAQPILLGGTGIATSPLGVLPPIVGGVLLDGGWMVAEGYGLGTAMAGTGLGEFMGTGTGVVASGVGSEPLE